MIDLTVSTSDVRYLTVSTSDDRDMTVSTSDDRDLTVSTCCRQWSHRLQRIRSDDREPSRASVG